MSDLQGMKIMVIDDSSTIRRTAELFLSKAGCTVLLAEDGFAALAQINDHAPDIIFCDILLQKIWCGGSYVAHRVRERIL